MDVGFLVRANLGAGLIDARKLHCVQRVDVEGLQVRLVVTFVSLAPRFKLLHRGRVGPESDVKGLAVHFIQWLHLDKPVLHFIDRFLAMLVRDAVQHHRVPHRARS